MKFKKLLSSFLSVAMCMSMFTAMPIAHAETFNDTVIQTVFELNADDIKAGNVPEYVNVNTDILDSTNTSNANGVLSTTVTADTNFIQVDLDAAAKALSGTDTGLYTIEIVTNAVDSDSATKNGTIMYANGNADKLLLRNREGSDVTTNNNDWSSDQYKAATTITKAYYTIEDLNLTAGTATSHTAKYDTATATGTSLFSGVANGNALTAWPNAPVRGITIKAANGYRANIESFKITRKATFTSESYLKQAQTVFEMNADTLKAGTVPAGVTLNTSILDSANSSAANGLVSDSVTADTNFITIDFEKATRNLLGGDTGIYTIELVANAIDGDSAKNGTLMYINGTSDAFAFRAREGTDFSVLTNAWGSSLQYKSITTNTTANYTMKDLKLSDGTGTHTATYDTATATGTYLFTGVAHDSTLSAWSGAPITGITIKAANGYRANIKSLKITRTAYIPNIKYTISATSENENYGTVAIEGLTDGKVLAGGNVTLTATAAEGYIFKGWYKNGADTAVSTEKSYTFVATEDASYVAKFTSAQEITQTVFEMNADTLKSGTVPAGVTLNTTILNSASSSDTGLMSNVVTAETEFLKIDFAELAKSLPGEETGIYTIDVVTNAIDDDSTTKNGTIIYVNGTSDIMVLRSREAVDFTVLKNDWSGTEYKAVSSVKTSHYTMSNLNLSTGAGVHTAKYNGDTYLLTSIAHDSNLGAWSGAPITGITFKAAKDYRANIKSLKITRKALVESVTYTINATTENTNYGTVATAGVSEEEATMGQVSSGTEVTLTATPAEGYLFKGWYKEGEDVPTSTEKVWKFAASESANYTARFVEAYVINKTVFELDAASLESGTVPAGITLATSILDEDATSASAGLISDVVAADTDFLTINLAEVGIETGEEGKDIYTIELVTNVNDSDADTKNGAWMYFNGTKKVFRARESSDFCVMNSSWVDPAWNATTAAEAHYTISALNAKTGVANSHLAQRMTDSGLVNQYSSTATGEALSAWSGAPVTTLTIKAISGYRANIKSLKITRQVAIPLEYVNVEAITENDAYGIVSDIGDRAIKQSNITLTATAKDGYIFDGWYNGSALVSEANPWNFEVTEGFSYTAKFRKVVDEWVEVYDMDIASILAGTTTNGVAITNLDSTNSSAANGLLSSASSTSSDFMTITFANLPTPEVDESAGDVLTDIYRVDMKVNLVDNDDATKNGALVYYNEVGNSTMLLRARETRDGTVYKDGTNTIYGASVGSQQIPSLAYNFIMDTETGAFNQYVKHGIGDYYIFTDTASRGDDITLANQPEKIIIRNASYTNEAYRANIKSLSVKRLVKVVDTGNAVPVFSKERVTVVANSGEIWNGSGEFTTDVEKIVIDFGSEIDSTQITQDSVYITCDDVKIDSTPSAELKDGVTLVTLTGMTFEDGKTYKIVANDIVNVRGASLQKEDEYVAIKAKSSYEGITVSGATIGGNAITAASDIAANTEVTVNVAHTNVATEKNVYVLYVAYKGGTKADVKLAKVENIIGNGNKTATFTTGNVSDVEGIDFIIWEGWNSMKLFDSFGF